MQPLRLRRWGSSILPLAGKQCCPHIQCPRGYSIRTQASAALSSQEARPVKKKPGRPRKSDTELRQPRRNNVATSAAPSPVEPISPPPPPHEIPKSTVTPTPASVDATPDIPNITQPTQTSTPTPQPPRRGPSKTATEKDSTRTLDSLQRLPSPPVSRSRKSAKLAALHARLQLPRSLPYETLARCLVDKTADPDLRFNNHNLSVLGNDLLGYYTTEHFICHYPRLPQVVLQAAVSAHCGPKALHAIAQGWGIEYAAEPGGEVDTGLLQFRRALPMRRDAKTTQGLTEYAESRTGTFTPEMMTPEHAAAGFVRAVFAAIYLHSGADRVKEFFSAHVMSRSLDLHSLFTFYEPTRDLSRLCAREGFESPIARVISETGRKSAAPVFVVGVFSGWDKIGEDAASSLDEARWKAAAKALKGWYLYKPQGEEIMVPSMMEGKAGEGRTWRKAYVDVGEVIA